MLIRCAFLRGRPKTVHEDPFAAFVRERLVPLWTRFPGADEVPADLMAHFDGDIFHTLFEGDGFPLPTGRPAA